MTYDYVIVGAGSAGCVLASGLSEEPAAKILLLEAGSRDKKQEIHIPAAFGKLFKSDFDWNYSTEPQSALNGRSLYQPRGKVLGGSSSMNAMVYIRGHRSDFDNWRDLGNEGWGYSDVLPYFKKSENNELGESEFHGTGGPLNVSRLRTTNPLSECFVTAGVELGYPQNNDFNGAEQEGFGFYQVTQSKGRRCSAAAYLKRCKGRKNLDVRTNAHVLKLNLDDSRVTGVEFSKNARLEKAEVSGEVILCGGAFNSPQLLMLSGIGPQDKLARAGITVKNDVPAVGENLHDDLLVAVTFICKQPVTLANAESKSNILKYLLLRKGQLTSNVAEAGAFVKTDSAHSSPDLQFHFGPVYYINHGFVVPEGHGFTIAPTLIRAKSRGHVELASGDPLSPPKIDPRYLNEQHDLQTLIEGVRLAFKLAATNAFGDYNGGVYCQDGHDKISSDSTDEQITEFIRATAETIYHPTGTCRMGTDDRSVVDPSLRVHGMKNLRVVDASVFPDGIGGNPNAAVIMIAEKASDLIKQGQAS